MDSYIGTLPFLLLFALTVSRLEAVPIYQRDTCSTRETCFLFDVESDADKVPHIVVKALSDVDLIFRSSPENQGRLFMTKGEVWTFAEMRIQLQFVKAQSGESSDAKVASLRCKQCRIHKQPYKQDMVPPPARKQKRALEKGLGFWLDRISTYRCVWYHPIYSRHYDINTLALVEGSDCFGSGHAVQLADFQVSSLLYIPAMEVTGPVFSTEFTDQWDGVYSLGRSLLRFSPTDVAWVLWNHNNTRPAWNGNQNVQWWRKRSPNVPGEWTALIKNVPLD